MRLGRAFETIELRQIYWVFTRETRLPVWYQSSFALASSEFVN